MTEMVPKDVFLKSLERCLATDRFMHLFYQHFINESEDVRNHFRNSDMDRQYRMLSRSLELCAEATTGNSDGLAELNELAKKHDRDHKNISPELYDIWLESIITTGKECDSEWTDDVESAWRRILGHVIRHMIKKY